MECGLFIPTVVDEEVIQNLREAMLRTYSDPEARNRVSQGVRARWARLGERERHSVTMKAVLNNPVTKEKQSKANRLNAQKMWEDPGFRERMLVVLARNNARFK